MVVIPDLAAADVYITHITRKVRLNKILVQWRLEQIEKINSKNAQKLVFMLKIFAAAACF